MLTPTTQLKNIPKITPKYLKLLDKLDLKTVQDLLLYFPFRYDDFSKIVPVSQEYVGQTVTISGVIQKKKLARIFRRQLTIAEIVIQDENNTPMKALWFNQPYILESLPEGAAIRLSGKLEFKGRTFSMVGPAWERAERSETNTGILVPVYPETKGLTSKWLRWQMKMILEQLRHPMSKLEPMSLPVRQAGSARLSQRTSDVFEEPLPMDIRERLHLYDIYTALRQIHFPEDSEKLLRAQKRFAFQEMFLVQLKTLQVKREWEQNNSLKIAFEEKLVKAFVNKLPFKLTDAQRKASFEILKDLEKNRPMNRLLNGDVGSGKTVVATIAALQAIDSGYQVAILAPTEVLARQHFESFCKLFENYDFNIALLTNSYKLIAEVKPRLRSRGFTSIKRDELIKDIATGNIRLVIGTHALIQKDVKFENLALIVIDEQHRFGVAQRAFLQQETMQIDDGKQKTIPHLLTMTATPIPRTLSIALFGSLDLSLLDEMPKNRKPILTKIIPPTGRKEVHNFIAGEIKNGRQVFVIFPLVEESKAMTEVKAATTEHKKLQEIFPEFKIGLLHGRLKAKEKESVMADFKDKKYDILVSTAVVEVGIDVPNASVMIIEDAERFGLSQLHQFRGRVGRGEHQSYCFLFSNSADNARLKALEETADGFQIAEKDLQLRGPGQFFGTLQSGLPDIAMKNLANVKLIKYSRAEAQNLLNSDPKLDKHPTTREALQRFSQAVHLE